MDHDSGEALRQCEERLWQANERIRLMESGIKDYTFLSTDPQGMLTVWNAGSGRLFGYSESEILGRDVAVLYTPEDRAGGVPQLERDQAAETGQGKDERWHVRKDGSLIYLSGIVTPVLDRAGGLLGFTKVARDMTERKRHEEEYARLVAASERRRRIYETVLSSTPDFNFVFDLGGRFTYVNAALLDLWRLGLDESLGRDFFDLDYPPDLAARLDRQIRQVIDTKQPVRDETPYTSHLGERQYEYIFVPVLGADGSVEAVAGSTRDITDRKRAENEVRAAKDDAEHANKAKDRFLAILSHELRTPLNPILLAVSAMLERTPEPGEVRPTLETIRQNVLLQSRLIDDLLDVMRIVQGKLPLIWEVADSHSLIHQAIQICQSEAFGKELRIEVDLGARGHYTNADPARFQQVIWNLVKNATKFTPGGGTITIRTRNEDGGGVEHLVIEAIDTGIGVEPDTLPLIFDPFQQGDTKITRKFGGLGLGLAICRGIVESHGGELIAESEGKDRGTTFRIILKTIPSPEATDGEPTGSEPIGNEPITSPAAPSSLKLLIVEDEPATLRLMARLLRGLGHEVTTADTIASALAAEADGFDLIVSDIGLPDGSGLDLMRQIVTRRGPVPSIALTGYGMEDDIQKSRDAGFTAHLTKPIDFTKLEAMIRQVAPVVA